MAEIPLAADDPLQDFTEATIKALEVLKLRVECLMLSRNWDELVEDTFRVCEAAHDITGSINRVYRERTNAPFIGWKPPRIKPHSTLTKRPSLHSLGDLL